MQYFLCFRADMNSLRRLKPPAIARNHRTCTSNAYGSPFRRVYYQIQYSYCAEHNTDLFILCYIFGPLSGHHQACEYKNLTKEDV